MGSKFIFLESNSHKMETALQEDSLCEFCEKKNLNGMKTLLMAKKGWIA